MAGHLPATGSVWAIQDTANKTVSFGRGLLEAATSDDINPLAVGCCAAFGTVIPVAIETRTKIEQLARRNHTSHVFNFIKAAVGYKKDDSVEQLSRSDSGVRFLCLCATLCSFDLYDAADRLDTMLQSFRKGEQLRPTVKQLQVMLKSLKNKLELSDFASSIVGYEILIRSKLVPLGEAFAFEVAQIPAKGSLQDLVQAIHNIGRPVTEEGGVDSYDVRLHAHHVPWTSAFIKWILGFPPTIKTSTGLVVLDQPQAPMTLFIVPNASDPVTRKRTFDLVDRDLSVAVKHKPKSLRELVFYEAGEEKRRAWQGLVSAETWLRYHFNVLHIRFPELEKDEKLMLAVRQALGYIVKYLPERLILCGDIESLRHTMSRHGVLPDDLYHRYGARPFLDADTRWMLACKLTSEIFQPLDEEQDPSGVLMPQNLSKRITGSCQMCTGEVSRVVSGAMPCRVHELLEAIGTIGSVLLMLTLFGQNTDAYPMLMAGLKFNSNVFHGRTWWQTHPAVFARTSFETLVTTGWQLLMHRKSALLSCSHNAILKFAAEMTGNGKISDATLICSRSSQVLFPAFLEAQDFVLNGYMQLCVSPGRLLMDNMEFQFLIDRSMIDADDEDLADGDSVHSEMDDGEDAEVPPSNSDESEHEMMDSALQAALGDDDEVDDPPENADESHRDATATNELQPDEQEVPRKSQIQADFQTHSMPRDFMPKMAPRESSPAKLQWKVFVHDEILQGELQLVKGELDQVMHVQGTSSNGAWVLMENLPFSRFTPQCSHPRKRTAGPLADHFELHDGPPHLRSQELPRALFYTGQCYALQISGLGAQDYWPPTVIHHRGCIQCALQVCLDVPSHLIIF